LEAFQWPKTTSIFIDLHACKSHVNVKMKKGIIILEVNLEMLCDMCCYKTNMLLQAKRIIEKMYKVKKGKDCGQLISLHVD
jgi:hypothetical protein